MDIMSYALSRKYTDEAIASSGGGITRTILYEAPNGGGTWMDATGKTITLSDDIDNYDEIEIITLTTEGDNNFYYAGSQRFSVPDILIPGADTANKSMCFTVVVYRTTGMDESCLRMVLIPQAAAETAKRTIYCNGARGIYGAAIHKIIGIKY